MPTLDPKRIVLQAGLLTVVLVCCIMVSYAQNSRLDSLTLRLNELKNQQRSFPKDTLRVRLLNEIGQAYQNPDQAKPFYTEAIELSKKIKWKKGEALGKISLGHSYIQNYLYFQAIDELNQSLEIGKNIKDYNIITKANTYLGSAYYTLEEDSLAIYYYKEAAALLKNTSLRQYCIVNSNIGLCLIRQKKYVKAIQLYKELINLYKPVSDALPVSWFYSNLGSAQQQAGLYSESVISFDSSLHYTPLHPVSERAFTQSEKAMSLLYLGDKENAVRLAKEAAVMGEKTTNFEKTYIYENLYKILKTTDDADGALNAYEEWMELKNQNDQDLKKKSLEGIKLYYENQKKEIRLQQEGVKSQLLLFGLGSIVIVLMVVFFNNRKLDGKNKLILRQKNEITQINQNLEEKVEERTAELRQAYLEIKQAMQKGQKFERERVATELHDNLGGMISSIKFQMQAFDDSSLLEKEKQLYKRIYSLIGNAYDEVRNISHNLLPKKLKEQGLKGAIKELIHNLNESNHIDFQLVYPNQLSVPEAYEIDLYSIILEVVNNSIKHSKAKKVILIFSSEGSAINVLIEDDGIGFDLNHVPQGNGLLNIRKRIDKLGGTLHINSQQDGSEFLISLPQPTY